jgi:ubiquinone/menaquinone biosynthesis C-methylase UbiE
MSEVFEKDVTVSQWDDDYYHPIALKLYDSAVADMLMHLNVEPGATILDAGCGPGVHSIRVAKAGYKVSAIDISQTMLQEAKQRATEAGVADKMTFSQQDLTSLTFDDNSFKCAFSWGVIIHIPQAEKALSELARVIMPGGRLALYVTNYSSLDYKIEGVARALLGKPLQSVKHDALGEGITYQFKGEPLWLWRFSTKGLVENLEQHGFRIAHRRLGEFSEIQRRISGFPRRCLLRLNNLAYRLSVPASLGVSQLLVFEKKS